MLTSIQKLLYFGTILLLLHINTTKGHGKIKYMKTHPSPYKLHSNTEELKSDHQVTIFLKKNEIRTYYFRSVMDSGHLSATVTPCSSTISWSFQFRNNSNTIHLITTNGMHTENLLPSQGIYELVLKSLESSTYIHIYVSTEFGGPQALQNVHHHQLRIFKSSRKNRLLVHWEPSLVDPQVTDYCLVISTIKNYTSLCNAETNKFGLQTPGQTNSFSKQPISADPVIVCVGKRTHYRISNLKHLQTYYLSVFAQNLQSNLTYPYGSTSFVYNKRIEPINLQRNKASYINLKKYDGKAVFRYKIFKDSNKNKLSLFVMPCGGSIIIQIKCKHETILNNTQIDKSERFDLHNLLPGWYNIKISAIKENFRNVGVEILASTSPTLTKMLTMPKNTTVQQLMKGCDSVTIGWLSPPGQQTANYCITVKETNLNDDEDDDLNAIQWPNQCGLERRLRKSANLKYCKQIKHHGQQVITEKISQLKAGHSYMVQVTVKKAKGKTFAYDLVKVFTAPSCHIWH